MKKIFTLIVAAFMAVSVNAQTETPLVLGGDWNALLSEMLMFMTSLLTSSMVQQSLPAMSTLQIILSISSSSKNRSQLPGELYLEDFC